MRPGRPNDRLVGLTGTRFEHVEWVAETGSTNADLLARARAGADDGLVLVADHQAAGRGRLGRAWQAPPGASLLVSVLLRPDVPLGRAHLLTVALGLAAVEALEALGEVPAALKWPNDVVVPDSQVGDGPLDRKLGGILAESVVEHGSLSAVVVGMGLNVTWPPVLPAELATIAVAANHVSDVALDRADLLVAILVGFERLLAELGTEAGTAELRRRHLARCRTIGRDVRVELAGGSFTGRAEDVTDEGHLVVATADGRREVTAGDVVHLRPADPAGPAGG
jgi:BirA family biotin operon repressor/biotin-[acetyl-CoA-carboxylase] ligase